MFCDQFMNIFFFLIRSVCVFLRFAFYFIFKVAARCCFCTTIYTFRNCVVIVCILESLHSKMCNALWMNHPIAKCIYTSCATDTLYMLFLHCRFWLVCHYCVKFRFLTCSFTHCNAMYIISITFYVYIGVDTISLRECAVWKCEEE